MNTTANTYFLLLGLLVSFSGCVFVVQEGDKLENGDSTQIEAPIIDSSKIILPVNSDSAATSLTYVKGEIDTRNVKPADVLNYAHSLIGVPYRYASSNPAVGFDCSGFITHVFGKFKIIVPRSSIGFTHIGKQVEIETSKPGDIILFTGTDSTERFVGHMGIITSNIGGAMEFIHSTSGKKYGVTVTPFNDYYKSRYVKTIRIFPQNDL